MRVPRPTAIALLGAAAATLVRPAAACGVSGPDGVSGCSLAEHEEAARPHFRVGANGAATWTALTFGGGNRGDQTRVAVVGTVAYDPTRRTTVEAALGAALGGELDMPAGRYVFAPGPTAFVGASWRALEGKPFLSLSANISFVASTTEASGVAGGAVGYEALDARGGVTFGTTVFDVLSPYLLARAFGGPVFWRYQGAAVTGTDVSHYQVGGGFALFVARRVDVFVEGVPLGERALAGGAAVAF